MKRDHRSFISACEHYIRLRSNQFPTEESKILWALAYLKGEKAERFANRYERIMYQPGKEKYMHWTYFKNVLAKYAESGERDVNAAKAMHELQYNGDIEAYIDKLQYLNERAQMSTGTLKLAVREGLPNQIIERMFDHGELDTINRIWEALRKAGLAYEAVSHALKKKEPSMSNSNKDSKPKPSNGEGKEKSDDKSGNQSSKGNKPNKVSKSKGKDSDERFPEIYKNYKEATRGVPFELVKQRIKDKVCSRCGYGPHDVKRCKNKAVKEANPTNSTSTAADKSTKTASAAVASKVESTPKPTAAISMQASEPIPDFTDPRWDAWDEETNSPPISL